MLPLFAQIGARDSVQVGWMGKCKAFAQMMALSGLLLALPTEDALPWGMSRDFVYNFSILRWSPSSRLSLPPTSPSPPRWFVARAALLPCVAFVAS